MRDTYIPLEDGSWEPLATMTPPPPPYQAPDPYAGMDDLALVKCIWCGDLYQVQELLDGQCCMCLESPFPGRYP